MPYKQAQDCQKNEPISDTAEENTDLQRPQTTWWPL
jgi:hypothetical protein